MILGLHEIPRDRKTRKARAQLDRALRDWDPKDTERSLAELQRLLPSGVRVLGRASQKEGEDCLFYATGERFERFADFGRRYPTLALPGPRRGDLAVYGDIEGGYRHAGVYTGHGSVRSQWGHSAVFRHPVDLVPSEYGGMVAFFRREPR